MQNIYLRYQKRIYRRMNKQTTVDMNKSIEGKTATNEKSIFGTEYLANIFRYIKYYNFLMGNKNNAVTELFILSYFNQS